jgi:hypothetical protein
VIAALLLTLLAFKEKDWALRHTSHTESTSVTLLGHLCLPPGCVHDHRLTMAMGSFLSK